MPSRFRTFEMHGTGAGTRYDLTSRLIVPRPIAFVSTVGADGKANLAPFSYFAPGGVNPPSLVFCPVLDAQGRPKDTLANIELTKEFVVNLVDRPLAEGMNQTSYPYQGAPREWEVSGFTMLQSRAVVPPRVAESPVQFECRLFDLVRHGSSSGSSVYVVGEILVVHVAEDLVDDAGRPLERFQPIARLGGSEYLDLACGKVFELERPNGPAATSLD